MAKGYDENFLDGITIKLPTFSNELAPEILINKRTMRDDYIQDYIHYSIIMSNNPLKRSPVVVALNINQTQLKKTTRKDNWRIDEQIGEQYQLDNDYYAGDDNPWDRGHMAKRESSAWSRTQNYAQKADDDTFYFSNSCLQHAELNRNDWAGLEDWVLELEQDSDGKISSFTGPIYAPHCRRIQPKDRTLALIPAAFFKIVCFKNQKTGKLDVRAFIMFQDAGAFQEQTGPRHSPPPYTNKTYQVTIGEIEQLTGLQFEQALSDANPLYTNKQNAAPDLNVTYTPERIEISHLNEIIKPNQKRPTVKDHLIDIFIAAAMVNPEGKDENNEWISIINLSTDTIDLTGWSLINSKNSSLVIDDALTQSEQRKLYGGQSIVINIKAPLRLTNSQDTIKLMDETGARIDRVSYTANMVESGKPVIFLTPTN